MTIPEHGDVSGLLLTGGDEQHCTIHVTSIPASHTWRGHVLDVVVERPTDVSDAAVRVSARVVLDDVGHGVAHLFVDPGMFPAGLSPVQIRFIDVNVGEVARAPITIVRANASALPRWTGSVSLRLGAVRRFFVTRPSHARIARVTVSCRGATWEASRMIVLHGGMLTRLTGVGFGAAPDRQFVQLGGSTSASMRTRDFKLDASAIFADDSDGLWQLCVGVAWSSSVPSAGDLADISVSIEMIGAVVDPPSPLLSADAPTRVLISPLQKDTIVAPSASLSRVERCIRPTASGTVVPLVGARDGQAGEPLWQVLLDYAITMPDMLAGSSWATDIVTLRMPALNGLLYDSPVVSASLLVWQNELDAPYCIAIKRPAAVRLASRVHAARLQVVHHSPEVLERLRGARITIEFGLDQHVAVRVEREFADALTGRRPRVDEAELLIGKKKAQGKVFYVAPLQLARLAPFLQVFFDDVISLC